jgi:hypothetical protein
LPLAFFLTCKFCVFFFRQTKFNIYFNHALLTPLRTCVFISNCVGL